MPSPSASSTRIHVVTKPMHAKSKEEMEENESSLHRVLLLLLHMYHVSPQKFRDLCQPLQQHQRLFMTSMEQMPTKATTAMRWSKTPRPTATSPWMSRWA